MIYVFIYFDSRILFFISFEEFYFEGTRYVSFFVGKLLIHSSFLREYHFYNKIDLIYIYIWPCPIFPIYLRFDFINLSFYGSLLADSIFVI